MRCWIVALLTAGLVACGGAFDDEPEIVDVEIAPATMTTGEASDTQQDVTIVVDGFDGEIVEASAFIKLNYRALQYDSISVDGDRVTFEGEMHGWFYDMDPGEYEVVAHVASDADEEVSADGLATVTIERR